MQSDKLVQEYKRSHLKSQKLHERAVKHFAAAGATHSSRIFDPFGPYITHAKGSRKWDVDGNEYIDYMLGGTLLILGYSHPAIVKAVQEQAAKGIIFGANHELEVEWADLIKSMMPVAERIEFCACGQEANLLALRLGRVFTGRKKILRLDGHYYGWSNELAAIGSPGTIQDYVVSIPANDLDRLEAELAKKEYAVLMAEALGADIGRIPLDFDYVRAIPDLVHKYGTVWLLDEVISCFRDGPGSWQSVVGVKPDLTTLGKDAAGGLPVGIIVGRSDIMSALSPQTPPEQRIKHLGGWNANSLTCAAGIAACRIYKEGEIQRKLTQIKSYFLEKGNKALKERGINGYLYGGSIIKNYLGPIDYEPSDEASPPTRDVQKLTNPAMIPILARLCLHLLQRHIATLTGRNFCLSAAHTKEDIDQTIRAFGDSLDAMIAEGTLSNSYLR